MHPESACLKKSNLFNETDEAQAVRQKYILVIRIRIEWKGSMELQRDMDDKVVTVSLILVECF